MELSTAWTEKKTNSPFRKAIEMMALFRLLVVASVMKERRSCGNSFLVRARRRGTSAGGVGGGCSSAGGVEVCMTDLFMRVSAEH